MGICVLTGVGGVTTVAVGVGLASGVATGVWAQVKVVVMLKMSPAPATTISQTAFLLIDLLPKRTPKTLWLQLTAYVQRGDRISFTYIYYTMHKTGLSISPVLSVVGELVEGEGIEILI
jgi:hypothetical protein